MSGKMNKRHEGFLMGILCALQTMQVHDQPTMAMDIVNDHTSMEELESFVGSKEGVDRDTLDWLQRGGLSDE